MINQKLKSWLRGGVNAGSVNTGTHLSSLNTTSISTTVNSLYQSEPESPRSGIGVGGAHHPPPSRLIRVGSHSPYGDNVIVHGRGVHSTASGGGGPVKFCTNYIRLA
jgi:hypothetical protein